MNLIERVKITQETIDQFLSRDFEWKSCDCAVLAHHHLERAGIETPFAQANHYTTPLGAVRALRKLGFDSIEAMADRYLERIPPAFALAGDILGFEGEPVGKTDWLALGIHTGESKALAFVEIGGRQVCAWGNADAAKVAWRLA